MPLYTITEKQNVNSSRKGVAMEFKSLPLAKRYATDNKVYYRTVMTIDLDGSMIAYKKTGERWVNI